MNSSVSNQQIKDVASQLQIVMRGLVKKDEISMKAVMSYLSDKNPVDFTNDIIDIAIALRDDCQHQANGVGVSAAYYLEQALKSVIS
jgi:hypothetical protein